jgi:hypothetical protein
MINYADNPASYPANVRLVTDSDAPNGANFQAGMQDLADRSAWLNANAVLSTGGSISGELFFTNGSFLIIQSGAEETWQGGASAVFQSLAILEIQAGALLKVDAGGTIDLLPGSALTVQGTAQIFLAGIAGIKGAAGSSIQAAASGAIDSLTPGGIRLSGGSSDNLAFNPPRTRPLAQWLTLPAALQTGWNLEALSLNGQFILVGPGTTVPQSCVLPITHNGATLASVTLNFAVKTGIHSALPTVGPTISVLKINAAIGAPVALGTSVFGLPGTVAAYEDSGATQSVTCPCTAGLSAIDNTQILYYLSITDENGAGAQPGNVFYSVILNYTNIVDSRFSI